MWSAIVKLGMFLWGIFFPPKGDPSTDQLVASNTEAQDQLKQEQTANAVDTQADATRISGDAAVLRILAATEPEAVNGAANAAVAKQFPDAFN